MKRTTAQATHQSLIEQVLKQREAGRVISDAALRALKIQERELTSTYIEQQIYFTIERSY